MGNFAEAELPGSQDCAGASDRAALSNRHEIAANLLAGSRCLSTGSADFPKLTPGFARVLEMNR
jgi:hypothetical protein